MKASRQRLFILTLLFIVTAINYMDRANLAVAGSNIQNDFSLTPTQLGLLFSMFTWAYAASQIPVGYVLDRIGSRILYGGAIILWSIFTFMMGFASHHLFATATASFAMLLACRALIGVAEAPSFPSNTKIIATWFPDHERARATAIYSSAQYIGLALLTPALAFIVANYGWEMSFYLSGGAGILFGIYWLMYYRDPQHSTAVNQAELDYIKAGGGYGSENQSSVSAKISWQNIKFFLSKKTIWGCSSPSLPARLRSIFPDLVYCLPGKRTASLYFQSRDRRHAALYYGDAWGALWRYAKRHAAEKGKSRTLARKLPVMAGLCVTMIIGLVNFFENQPVIAIVILSVAFFANAFSNLGWVVWSDVIPRNFLGTMGGFLNICGNLSGIVSPIVIGVILQRTQNFQYAMWYIAGVAGLGLLAYIFLVGKIEVILPGKKNADTVDKNAINPATANK